MASGTITFNADGVLQGKIEWSSRSNGSTANTSNVTATLYARRTDSYSTSGQSWSGYVKIANAQVNINFSNSVTVSSEWVQMAQVSTIIAHASDGSASVQIFGSVTGPSGTSLASRTSSDNKWVTLDKIPRYLTITSFSIKSTTINSTLLEWKTDVARNYTQYSLNDGDWKDANDEVASDNKSGWFIISDLQPNTNYTIKIRLRRTDSGLWTESTKLSTKTYDYARLTSVPNVNIGSAHTIQWTNPSGASISLKLCKTDNSTIIDYGTVTGTSKSITPTANTIYALTPNSNSYNAKYILTTSQAGKTYTNSREFRFDVINSNPRFNNFYYNNVNNTQYVGGTLNQLTGNNKIIVKGYTTISVNIPTEFKATAINGANMTQNGALYKVVIGSVTKTANYSSTATVTLPSIEKVNTGIIKVYAVDSRGNQTSVTENATFKDYSDLTIKGVSAIRANNGVGSNVTLNFNGSFWNENFGAVTNTITSATYQYKKTNETTWHTGATALTYSISGANYNGSISIQGDEGTAGFNISNSYNIRLNVSDKLITKSYDIILTAGTPAIAIYKSAVAIGQKYDTSKGGRLQVRGACTAENIELYHPTPHIDFHFNESTSDYTSRIIESSSGTLEIMNNLKVDGNIDGTTTKAIQNTKGEDLIETYARAGSKDSVNEDVTTLDTNLYRTGLYTITDTSGTWWNFINLRHRNGYGDGANYGMQIKSGLVDRNDALYVRKQSGSLWSSWEKIPRWKVLYENASGTTGTITLNENTNTFEYLEIVYCDNNSRQYRSMFVRNAYNKVITIDNIEPEQNGTHIYFRTSQYTIGLNTITFNHSTFVNLWKMDMSINNSAYNKIIKIIGWR